jgi:thioredoxin reductase (NADPH)
MGRKSMTEITDVVIIGGGPAGISAAIWCKRLGISHLLLESRSILGGQLPYIENQIIDYPGLITKNGQELQGVFNQHMNKLQCSFRLNASVLAVDHSNGCLTVEHEEGHSQNIDFRYIIFATGSSPRRLNIPGESEMINRGEVYSASKHRSHFKHKQVAVVGGGDRAFEGALLLAESGAHVVLIHHSEHFQARKEYVDPVLTHPNIRILTNFIVHRIEGHKQVTGIGVTSHGWNNEFIPVDVVLIRIGVKPNSELLQGVVDVDEDQYIQIDQMYRTSQHNIFAVGDVCTRPLYSSISSSTGQGMVAAKTISTFL